MSTLEVYQLAIGHNVRGTPTLKRQDVIRALSRHWAGFTTFEATGAWRGELERTTIVQIALTSTDATKLRRKVVALCNELRQESIMVTGPNDIVSFVSAA